VLSTVHTNSAAGTITRLLDMGVENYLLASTVTGILAQRLVRRLCRQCSAPAEASPLLLENLGKRRADLSGLRKRVGCRACRNTGYLGRTTISELLVMSETVRQCVLATSPETAIEAAAVEGGMVGMFEDGIDKALRGETTIDEVLRVTRMS
jgi:general secretion pathway protein E